MPRNGYDEYGPSVLPHGNRATLFAMGLRPYRVRSPWVKRFVVWTVVLVFAAALVGTFAIYGRSGTLTQKSDEFQKRTTSLYNPSLRVRFPDVGLSVIYAYYGGCLAPVQVSSALTWPNEGDQADDGTTVGSCKSQAASDPSDPDQAVSQTTVTNVSFSNGYQVPLKVGTSGYKNPYQEVDTYTAVVNNQPLTISLSLGIPDLDNPKQAPVLLTLPTLGPPPANSAPDTTNKPETAGMPGYDAANNPALASALSNWATAWASNDQAALKQATQDSTSRVYTGLGGWTLTSSSNDGSDGAVTWSWGYVKSIGGTKYAVAEVTFTITSADKTGKKRYDSLQTMDILVKGYGSSLPAVVAWGSAGSWSTLVPYQNGVRPDPNAQPSDDESTPAPGAPTSGSTSPVPNSTPSR